MKKQTPRWVKTAYLYILHGTPIGHLKIMDTERYGPQLIIDPEIIKYRYDVKPVKFLDWLDERSGRSSAW